MIHLDEEELEEIMEEYEAVRASRALFRIRVRYYFDV
jgi:hypothetical protein